MKTDVGKLGKGGKTNAAILPDPLHGQQQSFRKVRVEMSKALPAQTLLQTTIAAEVLRHRRARTRLLVQAGDLLSLSSLLQICGIDEEDDLQLDLETLDKAARPFSDFLPMPQLP